MLLPTGGQTRPGSNRRSIMQHTIELIVFINSVPDLAALPVLTSWSAA
jgi:hypothetical protein